MSTPAPQPSVNPTSLLAQILERAAARVPPHCFDIWFRPLVFARAVGSAWYWMVPNEYFKTAFLQNYAQVLQQLVEETAGVPVQLHLTVPTDNTSRQGPSPLPIVRAADLRPADHADPWLIDGLWTAQAVGILGGPPKSLKTWLALEMAVSVSSATPCLQTFPVDHAGPVLLYAAEDSAAALRDRLLSLAAHHGCALDTLDLHVITADSLRLDRADDQARLQDAVANLRPALLILDPLVRIHQVDENVAGCMAALLAYFRALQRTTGVAIVLVHHARKNLSAGAAAGNGLRGSSDLYAWLDSLLYVHRRRDQITLSVEHRSAPGLGPLNLQLLSGNTGLCLKLSSAPETPLPQPHLQQRILQLLSNSPAPLSTDTLRSTLKVRKQRLVEALDHLRAHGQIQRLHQGYALQ